MKNRYLYCRNRFALVLFFSILLMVLFTSPVFTGGAQEPGKKEAVTITLWIQSYGNDAAMSKVLDDINKRFAAQTGNRAEYSIIQWGEAEPKHMLAAQGGEAPDIMDEYWLFSRVAAGKGEFGPFPMNDVFAEKFGSLQAWEKNYYEVALSYADVKLTDGNYYGVPWRIECRPMLIRTDLFKEAGIVDANGNAKPPTTYRELLEYAQKLTIDKNGDGVIDQYGIALGWGPDLFVQGVMQAMYQGGSRILNAEATKSTLYQPTVIEALQYWRDAVCRYKVLDPGVLSPSYNGMVEIQSGRAAMNMTVNAGGVAELKSKIPDLPIKSALVPRGPATAETTAGAAAFVPYKQTKHLDETLEYLWFLTDPDNVGPLLESIGLLPADRRVAARPFFADDPMYKVHLRQLEFAGPEDYPIPEWAEILGWSEGAPLHDLIVGVLDCRGGSVEELVKTAHDKINALLKD